MISKEAPEALRTICVAVYRAAVTTGVGALPAQCDIASRALFSTLSSCGIESQLACGRYRPDNSKHYRKYVKSLERLSNSPVPDGSRPVTHHWVRSGEWHLDIAVRQFGSLSEIYIGRIPFIKMTAIELLFGDDVEAQRERERVGPVTRFGLHRVEMLERQDEMTIREICAMAMNILTSE